MSSTVASRRIRTRARGPFDLYLKPGFTISFRTGSDEVVPAEVTEISERRLGLRLVGTSPSPPFQEGDRLRIKYWDEGSTVYGWWATVKGLEPVDDGRFVVSFSDVELNLERRKFRRLPLKIPFSFTVLKSEEAALEGRHVLDCVTQDISLGGLRFETDLPLQVGDNLGLGLDLSPGLFVTAGGWVVRTSHMPTGGDATAGASCSVGIQFLQSNPAEQRELLRFLSSAQRIPRS